MIHLTQKSLSSFLWDILIFVGHHHFCRTLANSANPGQMPQGSSLLAHNIVYQNLSKMRRKKNSPLARMCACADSHEPWLLANASSTKISCTHSHMLPVVWLIRENMYICLVQMFIGSRIYVPSVGPQYQSYNDAKHMT